MESPGAASLGPLLISCPQVSHPRSDWKSCVVVDREQTGSGAHQSLVSSPTSSLTS